MHIDEPMPEMCLEILQNGRPEIQEPLTCIGQLPSTRNCANCSSYILPVDPLNRAIKNGLPVSSF